MNVGAMRQLTTLLTNPKTPPAVKSRLQTLSSSFGICGNALQGLVVELQKCGAPDQLIDDLCEALLEVRNQHERAAKVLRDSAGKGTPQ